VHISRVRVRNFRNFHKATFLFTSGVNTLIGENGSGKTNAFYALRLLLDDSLSRGAVRLRESDFNRCQPNWRGHWIIISIDFEGLDASEGCQIIRHNVGHMDDQNNGTYTFFFRPNKAVRKTLYEYTESGGVDGDAALPYDEISIDQYEAVFTGRATADFLDDDVYKELVGDFESHTYPNPDDDDSSKLGDKMFQALHSEVSCTFVKALRDVIADLRNYRNSPLLNLLRGTEKKIEFEDEKKILEQISTLNTNISNLQEIRNISQGIQDTLYDTVGHAYSPEIDIRSAIPEEIDRLLQRLSLSVCDPGDEGYRGEIDELSLGGANLIYLSLKLLEYELKTASDRVAHFLLIEEPESHIHTHIQKTLFDKYTYDNTQVIVSTHSTHISAASRIRSVNILAKGKRQARVYHPAVGLQSEQCNRIERYLDAIRTTLLFAKGVILVEGDAELIVIPTLIRQVLGAGLDELGVSLIGMSSAVFSNVAVLFHDERIRRRCAILTDLDTSIATLPVDPDDDDKFEKSCRSSQKSGLERKALLDELCNDNQWLESFYATHTFEVAFLLADNKQEVIETLPNIYSQEIRKVASEAKLNDENSEVAGREVLRLAAKKGKGWFALLVAERITSHTYIPEYILQAVAFACKDTIDRQALGRMIRYRCEQVHKQDTAHRRAVLASLQKPKDVDATISTFSSSYRNDPVSKFAGYLNSNG